MRRKSPAKNGEGPKKKVRYNVASIPLKRLHKKVK